jgi:hypothetical protein
MGQVKFFLTLVNCYTLLGRKVTREDLGLPRDWSVVASWLSRSGHISAPLEAAEPVILGQCEPETHIPCATYWKNFPRRNLPRCPSTRVYVKKLEQKFKETEHRMTLHDSFRGKITIRNLKEGAPSHQMEYLKPLVMPNAESTKEAGGAIKELLKGWIESEFVAGPFFSPPVKDFRANSLMAIFQKDKIRPVLNLSLPTNKSFNDNVDQGKVPKVRNSSPKQFGQTLVQFGRGSVFSKADMRDAFKHVPARPEDWRLQGFSWHEAYFVDTQQIFGASTSVANFDNFAYSMVNIARAESNTSERFVHRTMDDVVCISPAKSGICESFYSTYKDLCEYTNVKLAEPCEKREKAFEPGTAGIVLGVHFDSEKMLWKPKKSKVTKALTLLNVLLMSGQADLKQIRSLAGRVNDLGQLAPFTDAFRRPLNDMLASFGENEEIIRPISEALREDLKFWALFIQHSSRGLPLSMILSHPPLKFWNFISDAAGGKPVADKIGVASVSMNEEGKVWFVARDAWPYHITHGSKDMDGKEFAQKMTMLESVGLILPFLILTERIRGKTVVLGVDNIGVVFGWENGGVKEDPYASVLIRALRILSAYLETRVFVEHVPRLSSEASRLADSLTRESSTTSEVLSQIRSAEQARFPRILRRWLRNPEVNWDLGQVFVQFIVSSHAE